MRRGHGRPALAAADRAAGGGRPRRWRPAPTALEAVAVVGGADSAGPGLGRGGHRSGRPAADHRARGRHGRHRARSERPTGAAARRPTGPASPASSAGPTPASRPCSTPSSAPRSRSPRTSRRPPGGRSAESSPAPTRSWSSSTPPACTSRAPCSGERLDDLVRTVWSDVDVDRVVHSGRREGRSRATGGSSPSSPNRPRRTPVIGIVTKTDKVAPSQVAEQLSRCRRGPRLRRRGAGLRRRRTPGRSCSPTC